MSYYPESLKNTAIVIVLALVSGCAVKEGPVPAASSRPRQVRAAPAPDISISGAEEGFIAAMVAYKRGEAETAFYLGTRVAAQYPNTPWYKRSLFLIERALIQLDRGPEADAAMLRVQAEYPELSDYAVYLLADYHFFKGRHTKSAALYKYLTEQYPKSFLAVRAAFWHAQSLLESSAFLPAMDAFEKFLIDYPQSEFAPEAGLGLGKALTAGARPGEAARAYLNVWVNYPGSSDQEVEKSLAELKARGVDIPGLTPEELYTRAKNLYRAGQYEKAAPSFAAALEADPKHPQKPDILIRSGIALYNLGKRQDSARTLEAFLREFPGNARAPEALNWLGKSYSKMGEWEKAEKAYLRIVADYPACEWADDALYLTGNVYRETNDVKKALKYYGRVVAEYPDSTLADSALWWKAWASYTAGDHKKAVDAMQELVSRYPRSFLVTQARYWQGRVAEKTGNAQKAAVYYQKALLNGPYTYYGYRAAERLSAIEAPALPATPASLPGAAVADEPGLLPDDPLESFDTDADAGPPVWTSEVIKALSSDPSFRKTLELMSLDMKKEAALELRALQERTSPRHGSLLGLSKAFFELGDYHSSILLVLQNYDRFLDGPARETPYDLWLLAYPQGHWDSITASAKKYGLDPYFIAAIIHQESRFHAGALSPAGARGVMQVMPATGEWIARTIKAPGFDREKLFDADTSIKLGAWYVKELMKRFKGDLLLVAAAYNAGPGAVAGWIGKHGGGIERDEFVESIPFSETRRYVKKVLRNYSEYKRIYGGAGQNARPSPLPSAEAIGALIAADELKLP